MASTYTSRLRLTKQAFGENVDSWGSIWNSGGGSDLLDIAISGIAVIALSASDVTLTTANGSADQARAAILQLSGVLSANVNVVIPNAEKFYIVSNLTSGAYTVSLKTSGGSAVLIPQNRTYIAWCDGANVIRLANASVDGADVTGTVANATNSAQLGGIVAANYARLDLAQNFTAGFGVTPISAAVSSNYSTDAALSNTFILSLTASVQLNNPSNLRDGQRISWVIIHSSAGTTLSFDTKFSYVGTGSSGIQNTGSGAIDVIDGIYSTAQDKIYYDFRRQADSASETVVGLVERATNTETKAGADTTRYFSPASLLALFQVSLTGADRIFYLPGGGCVQMGITAVIVDNDNISFSVVYATPFDTAPYIFLTTRRAEFGGALVISEVKDSTVTTVGFTGEIDNPASSSTFTVRVQWLAIGAKAIP